MMKLRVKVTTKTSSSQKLFEFVGEIGDSVEQTTVSVGEFAMTSRHDTTGDCEELREVNILEAGGTTLAERGDEYTRHTFADDVAPDADSGCGVEGCVDSRLGVVAHDESAELETCA